MKIYTKRGDDGTTALFGGKRVPKDELRIEAYGTMDEMNSWTGYLHDLVSSEADKKTLERIQEHLFTAGSVVATDPEKSENLAIAFDGDSAARWLEEKIDSMESELAPLRNFVLPGGHLANSASHICRCVCRRAERICVTLERESQLNDDIIRFLNRLSDFFFVFARKAARDAGANEITWKGS